MQTGSDVTGIVWWGRWAILPCFCGEYHGGTDGSRRDCGCSKDTIPEKSWLNPPSSIRGWPYSSLKGLILSSVSTGMLMWEHCPENHQKSQKNIDISTNWPGFCFPTFIRRHFTSRGGDVNGLVKKFQQRVRNLTEQEKWLSLVCDKQQSKVPADEGQLLLWVKTWVSKRTMAEEPQVGQERTCCLSP